MTFAGKQISTPQNAAGQYALVRFDWLRDNLFTCAACGAVLPEELLEQHAADRHTPPLPGPAAPVRSVEPAPEIEEPLLYTTVRETPTDVLIRAMTDMDKRRVDRVLVIQVSDVNTWFSSNMNTLELVGLLHEAFPKILQSLMGGEPKKL